MSLGVFETSYRVDVGHWFKEIEEHSLTDQVEVVLVGNKADLGDEKREVSYEEAAQTAQQRGILYVETSAKDQESVSAVFTGVADRAFANGSFGEHKQADGIALDEPRNQSSSNCNCG